VGEAAALASALCWAASGVAVTSLSTRLPAAALSALQMAVASVVLIAALVASGNVDELQDAGAATLLAVAGTGVIGFTIADPAYVRTLSLVGMQRTYPTTVALFILFTTLGGVLILGEHLSVGLVAGGALIVGGTYLIVVRPGDARPSKPIQEIPALDPRASTLALAVPARVARRGLEGRSLLVAVPLLWTVASLWLAGARGDLSAISVAAIRIPAATVLLTVLIAAARPNDLRTATADHRDVIAIGAAGVAGIAVGSLLYIVALIEAGAARSAVLSASSPLFAMPLAVLFLREPLTARVLLGTLVSVCGIVLVVAL